VELVQVRLGAGEGCVGSTAHHEMLFVDADVDDEHARINGGPSSGVVGVPADIFP
jgi:hypothetical protein